MAAKDAGMVGGSSIGNVIPKTTNKSKSSGTQGAVSNNDKATNTNKSTQVVYYEGSAKQAKLKTNVSNAKSNKNINNFAQHIQINSLVGIEGIPYQFLPTVDRRVNNGESSNLATMKSNSENLSLIGRKYTEKIITQIPLLFLTPCKPAFMDDNNFTKNDKKLFAQAYASPINNIEEILQGSGRFYSASYDYNSYYNYLNCMLTAVASYLGIGDEEIWVGNEKVKIKNADWAKETENTPMGLNDMAKKSLRFYIDSIDTINENFANSTTQSQFAGLINGFSDTTKEIDYFFGASGNNAISAMANNVSAAVSEAGTAMSSLLQGAAGGIVSSLSNGGVQSILDGGKVIFPEMWSDSSYDRSYSIHMALRSPDNDSLSIFLNVLKPYCKILCFTLPHMVENNVNTYRTPFICKAYCKGLFNVDLGMITGLSVSKGAVCAWNDDGLPTQIDLDIDIRDLYSQLTMTGYEKDSVSGQGIISGAINAAKGTFQQTYNIVNNTSYMDFLANMAGLNINEMVWDRKILMYYDLFSNSTLNVGNLWNRTVGRRTSNAITNFIGKYVYSW